MWTGKQTRGDGSFIKFSERFQQRKETILRSPQPNLTLTPKGPLPATRTRTGDQSLIAPLSSSYGRLQTLAQITNYRLSNSCLKYYRVFTMYV